MISRYEELKKGFLEGYFVTREDKPWVSFQKGAPPTVGCWAKSKQCANCAINEAVSLDTGGHSDCCLLGTSELADDMKRLKENHPELFI